MTSRRLPFNVRFEGAARYFAAKVPMTRPEFDKLADWAKVRAFTVAHVTKARALQGVMDAVQAAVDDGLTMGDFNKVLDDVVGVKLAPWHAETVFRTNTQMAYGVGRLQQQRAQRDDFPYIQIHEVMDDRTRESHRPRNGVVLALSDARVRRWYPPSDYNCRGYADSLSDEEARAIGISPTQVVGTNGDDNGFAGPGVGEDFDPDLSTLDPTLRASVRKALRDFSPSSVDD
jgi:SPP1 gp7 family putative phage head morphogenesis protein